MIPRLYPSYTFRELWTSLFFIGRKKTPRQMEALFCQTLGMSYALSFAYGRTALYYFLKALKVEQKEIILPAYTCEVMAAAVVLSGNIPRFVDISPDDFNMSIERVQQAVTPNTAAIIATHMYGFPMQEIDILETFCKEKNIYLIQDCALAPFSSWKGKALRLYGDAAIFSFSSGKPLSTIEGGMLATNQKKLYDQILPYIREHAREVSLWAQLREWVFGLALLIGLFPLLYPFTLLLSRWHLLNFATRIFDDKEIKFPANGFSRLSPLKARLGIDQLNKIDRIVTHGQEITHQYLKIESLDTPIRHRINRLVAAGAVLSHFPLTIHSQERETLILKAIKIGLQPGKEVFDYCVPELESYHSFKPYWPQETFAVSHAVAASILLLPLHFRVTAATVSRIQWQLMFQT